MRYQIQAVDLKNGTKGSMFGDYYNSLNFVVKDTIYITILIDKT